MIRDLRDTFSSTDYFHLTSVSASELVFEKTHADGIIRAAPFPRLLYDDLAQQPTIEAMIEQAFPDRLLFDFRAIFAPHALDDDVAIANSALWRLMYLLKLAVTLLLAGCAGDGPPKSTGAANPPPVTPTAPGRAMTQPAATQSPPKTTTEQVQRWAPAGTSVVDVRARGEADLDLPPGVDVFMVTIRNQPPADGRNQFSVVAIVGGVGNPVLEDKAAILAAVAKATKDAQKLARIGLLLGGRDDSPLTSASTDEQRKAGVKAPVIANNAIAFWIFSGSPNRNLYHCNLDLATAALTVGASPSAAGNVVDDAVSALQSGNPAALQQSLDALATACHGNPAAKKLLFDTLAHHASEDARAAAAYSAPKCGHDALSPLIASLEHDKSRIVRGKAAFALAELGDKSAIPALEKATTTDIASAAGIALDQLKKK